MNILACQYSPDFTPLSAEIYSEAIDSPAGMPDNWPSYRDAEMHRKGCAYRSAEYAGNALMSI